MICHRPGVGRVKLSHPLNSRDAYHTLTTFETCYVLFVFIEFLASVRICLLNDPLHSVLNNSHSFLLPMIMIMMSMRGLFLLLMPTIALTIKLSSMHTMYCKWQSCTVREFILLLVNYQFLCIERRGDWVNVYVMRSLA